MPGPAERDRIDFIGIGGKTESQYIERFGPDDPILATLIEHRYVFRKVIKLEETQPSDLARAAPAEVLMYELTDAGKLALS